MEKTNVVKEDTEGSIEEGEYLAEKQDAHVETKPNPK